MNMDITTLGTCVAIVALSYVVGLGCKAAKKIPDEWIPVIMAVVGGVLGALGMSTIPDFPASDYITAVALCLVWRLRGLIRCISRPINE